MPDYLLTEAMMGEPSYLQYGYLSKAAERAWEKIFAEDERIFVRRLSRKKQPLVLLLCRREIETGKWRLWRDVELIGFDT